MHNSSNVEQISVITTVRGGSEFLVRYFERMSNLAIFFPFQLIIIDDNDVPSDLLIRECNKLNSSGVDVRYKFSDLAGRAGALNLALDIASYRYCFIQDVDDVPFKARFAAFYADLSDSKIGAIRFYNGIYGYIHGGTAKFRKIPHSEVIDKSVYKGMPLPHTFMVLDKMKLCGVRYEDIEAGIDYRLLCRAFSKGLAVSVCNKRVGIHFKYPDSNFARKSKLKSQLAFLSSQFILNRSRPSIIGVSYMLARLIRLPFFVIIDWYKRRFPGF